MTLQPRRKETSILCIQRLKIDTKLLMIMLVIFLCPLLNPFYKTIQLRCGRQKTIIAQQIFNHVLIIFSLLLFLLAQRSIFFYYKISVDDDEKRIFITLCWVLFHDIFLLSLCTQNDLQLELIILAILGCFTNSTLLASERIKKV